MLKRKKQLLLAQTADYIKEAQVPLDYDPTVTPAVDSELIPTPPDPPQRECTLNNKNRNSSILNGHRGKENGYPSQNHHNQDDGELKPVENGHSAPPDSAPAEPKEPEIPYHANAMTSCMFEQCRLGCVCESVGVGTTRSVYETHCGTSGDPDCIFGCICHQIQGGERKKFRLRWAKVSQPSSKREDDDCGFIPPGSQISLAHDQDGRPKRKSQPPERFRHGFDLNKVTLDKRFSAGNSFRNNGSNGHHYHHNGSTERRRSGKTLLAHANGIRSRDRSSKSSTIKMLANGSIQKTRIIVGSNNQGHRVRFPTMASKFRSSGMMSQIRRGQPATTSKQSTKSSDKRRRLTGIGSVKNPCENHDHDYNMDSIVTGLALRLKCDSPESGGGGDGVLINRVGTVVAIISWTTDSYMKPTVSRLKFKREHTRSQSPRKGPSAVQSTTDAPTPDAAPCVQVHDADLSILCLPSEESKSLALLNGPCSSKAAAQVPVSGPPTPITSYYRFFDLPPSYHEYDFVLYSELHAVFAVNALRAKIKSVRGAAAAATAGAKTSSLGPKIVELNSINLNQPTDPARRGNVNLLIDSENLIVLGTIPEAYRERNGINQQQQQRSPLRAHHAGNRASC